MLLRSWPSGRVVAACFSEDWFKNVMSLFVLVFAGCFLLYFIGYEFLWKGTKEERSWRRDNEGRKST